MLWMRVCQTECKGAKNCNFAKNKYGTALSIQEVTVKKIAEQKEEARRRKANEIAERYDHTI